MELLSRKTKQEKNDLPERVIWLSGLDFVLKKRNQSLMIDDKLGYGLKIISSIRSEIGGLY